MQNIGEIFWVVPEADTLASTLNWPNTV